MAIYENSDYVYYPKNLMLNSKNTLKHVEVCIVSTHNYVFIIPKKSTGLYLVMTKITTHQFFDGVSTEEGLERLIADTTSVKELEKSMIELLDNDPQYVHLLADKSLVKFSSFLGNHSVRMVLDRWNWTGVTIKGKGNGKKFRAFHGK